MRSEGLMPFKTLQETLTRRRPAVGNSGPDVLDHCRLLYPGLFSSPPALLTISFTRPCDREQAPIISS